MIGIDNLIKNSTYELTENGVNLKVFGITYPCSEDQLDRAILFLMRLLERVRMIRKEKNDLTGIHAGP
jgi:hypothetical protein